MSILASNFESMKSDQYKGTSVFHYIGDRSEQKDITILHPYLFELNTDAKKKKINWWKVQTDIQNVNRVRLYFKMDLLEKELIKLYNTKKNKNLLDRVHSYINYNLDICHFFLSNVDKLFWINADLDNAESSGLSLEHCSDLVIEPTRSLNIVYATMLESTLPHKVLSSLMKSEIDKDNIIMKTNIGLLNK